MKNLFILEQNNFWTVKTLRNPIHPWFLTILRVTGCALYVKYAVPMPNMAAIFFSRRIWSKIFFSSSRTGGGPTSVLTSSPGRADMHQKTVFFKPTIIITDKSSRMIENKPSEHWEIQASHDSSLNCSSLVSFCMKPMQFPFQRWLIN